LAAASQRIYSKTTRFTRRENAGDVALFRLGGDEFTILLDALGDPSDAMRVAERMRQEWRIRFWSTPMNSGSH
jgi:GGDEF domain-containing protein